MIEGIVQELRQIARTVRRVYRHLGARHRGRLAAALGLMLGVGVLTSAPPMLLGILVDRYVKETGLPFSAAGPYLGAIVLVVLLREALQVARKYLVEDTCTRVEKETRVALVDHVLHLDLAFFTAWMAGGLNGRMSRSIDGFVRLIKLAFLDFLPSSIIAVTALVAVYMKNPIIGAAVTPVVPLGLWIVLRQIRTQKGIRIKLVRGKEEIDGTVVELLGGLEHVRAMDTTCFETERVAEVAERLRTTEIRHHIAMAWFDAAKYVNEAVFHVLVLGFAVLLAVGRITSLGDILVFSMLFAGVVGPLREVHRILDEAHESSILATDLFDLLDQPVDASFSPAGCEQVETMPPVAIHVQGVRYKHPGAREDSIRDVDLTIQRGEFVGICGPAGSGKSTLLRLLLRLAHPRSGSIAIAGRDIATLSRSEIARLVGYVGQSPLVLAGTVQDNIAYGLSGVTMDQIMEAATRANLHDEIMALPEGYSTRVGERGATLSGGQRQRLALARVFLRAPAVLLLDEATAALDNLNEKAVQEAIQEAMEGRTVLAVAHRLSTLRSADRIIVVDGGRIIQEGTYSALSCADGLFRRLLKAAEFEHDAAPAGTTGRETVCLSA